MPTKENTNTASKLAVLSGHASHFANDALRFNGHPRHTGKC